MWISKVTIIGVAFAAYIFRGPHVLAFDHCDGFSPYGNGFAPDVVSIGIESDSYSKGYNLTVTALNDVSASSHDSDLRRRAAGDFYLRIMPLGASITQGQYSSDENGYRKALRDQLRYVGWKVNMVGSLQDGTMADSDHEGHRGWTITQVHDAWTKSKWMMPNLVLINVGLNDCIQHIDTGNAGGRLKDLVDDIFNSVSGVTVIVSTLLRSTNADTDACTDGISKQYRDMVQGYKGARIALADVRSVMSMSDLGKDGDHPNDGGYKMFAGVWWNAISKIEDRLEKPTNVASIDDASASSPNQCKKVAGNAPPRVQSQMGSGHDDGNYVHSSKAHGVLKSAEIDKGSDPKSITDAIPWHIFFANLVKGDPNADRKQSLDDWIRIYHDTQGKNAYWFRQNLGGGNFDESVRFDVDMNCDNGPRYAFADFNNDGLDDFFCLTGDSVKVSLNQGGNPPKFKSIGQVIGNLGGYAATDVRIADIDGDGRADFCLIKSDGTIACSRNGGQGDSPQWQGFSTPDGVRGTVFSQGQGEKTGIIIADLNGDYRSDIMYVNDFGHINTWINNRDTGKSIVPKWRSAGLTHEGQKDTGIQENILLGRIYGSGRLDYIYLKEQDKHFDVLVWENTGSGGTKLKADGNFYCDMRGTGSDDYVWIYQDGHAAEINVNIHSPPQWGHDTKIFVNVPGPRIGIHLADWDGDGRCDILVQDKATGALTLYANRYDTATDRITFGAGQIANDGFATCKQGWGVGIFDRGMRIADVDGDGRADVLCIEKDGRISAVLNEKGGLNNAGQIKFSEGWDRSNIRFADVEASGRADLLHLDKYTGAITVFKNNGAAKAAGGSSFSWTNRGQLYNAIDRGENMHFSNQGGLGRADMIQVDPSTNKAWTYWNRCGGSGGDDGPIVNPNLPVIGGGSTPGAPEGDYPVVIDGFCEGPDCVGGICIRPLCVSYGCKGSGCSRGKCRFPSLCIPSICIGLGCTDGICIGSQCRSRGCIGPDCDSGSGRCKGSRCVSIGCKGSDCDSGTGLCRGNRCTLHACTGSDCVDGICIGTSCGDESHDDGGSCEENGCGGGGEGGGGNGPGDQPPDDPDEPSESCTDKKTASSCLTVVTSTIFSPQTTWTTWSRSDCLTSIGCDVTDFSSTTTLSASFPFPTSFAVTTEPYSPEPLGITIAPGYWDWLTATASIDFVDCTHRNEQPGQGINSGYCVCSGSTFVEQTVTEVDPPNSCGYFTMPTKTIDVTSNLPVTTDTAACRVCTIVGQNNGLCTSLPNCTPKTTVAPPPPQATGRLCLAVYTGVDNSNGLVLPYSLYKVMNPGDACNNEQSASLGGRIMSACEAGDVGEFEVCGKKVQFVHQGPSQEVEQGSSCSLQLQIDGVNYAGTPVFGTTDRTCYATCDPGFYEGTMLFNNVPVC